MTFWLDSQLDPTLAAWLGSTFKIIVKSTKEIGLVGADDSVLLDAAQRLRVDGIITKDEDFPIAVLRRTAPPSIIWLRCRNMRTVKLRPWLIGAFPEVLRLVQAGAQIVEIDEAGKCFAR